MIPLRYRHDPEELAVPFRDPFAPDYAETKPDARSVLTPALGTAVVQRGMELLVWPFAGLVLATFFSAVQAVVSRGWRALRAAPCHEPTLACLTEYVSAGLGIPSPAWYSPLYALVTLFLLLLIPYATYKLSRHAASWFGELDRHEPSRIALRLQLTITSPVKASTHNALGHFALAAALAALAITPFALLDIKELWGFLFTPPDFTVQSSRAKYAPAVNLAIATILFLIVAREAMIQSYIGFRLWREGSPEVLTPWKSTNRDESETIKVVHWSDLHLTDPSGKLLEGGSGGNEALERLIAQHTATLKSADAIIVTGDVTDAGLSTEWREFFRIVPASLRAKMVLVPGNHDINIVSATRKRAVESVKRYGYKLRLVRFLSVLDMVQGERTHLYWPKRKVSLRALLHDAGNSLNSFSESLEETFAGGRVLEIWDHCFPMMVDVAGTRFSIVVLNSIEFSPTLAGNAYGYIDKIQLRRLEWLLESRKERRLVFALHHHLALPPRIQKGALIARLQQYFLLLQNPVAVMAAFQKWAPAVVLHGHRHVGYVGKVHNLDVVSAPSTTLGCEAEQRGTAGFYVLEICERGDGSALKAMTFYG